MGSGASAGEITSHRAGSSPTRTNTTPSPRVCVLTDDGSSRSAGPPAPPMPAAPAAPAAPPAPAALPAPAPPPRRAACHRYRLTIDQSSDSPSRGLIGHLHLRTQNKFAQPAGHHTRELARHDGKDVAWRGWVRIPLRQPKQGDRPPLRIVIPGEDGMPGAEARHIVREL